MTNSFAHRVLNSNLMLRARPIEPRSSIVNNANGLATAIKNQLGIECYVKVDTFHIEVRVAMKAEPLIQELRELKYRLYKSRFIGPEYIKGLLVRPGRLAPINVGPDIWSKGMGSAISLAGLSLPDYDAVLDIVPLMPFSSGTVLRMELGYTRVSGVREKQRRCVYSTCT